MAHIGPVARWELYWADLDPAVGSEQAGSRRPVLVVSNNEANGYFPIVTIVPLTKAEGKTRKIYPFEVKLPRAIVGNEWESIVMPYQVRTISKLRLLERIGTLEDPGYRERIEDALLGHLGIELENDD